MEKAELVAAAQKITAPSTEAANAYTEAREKLLAEMNETMKSRSDILELIGGEENLSMMLDNHHNHTKFMNNLFKNYQGQELVETIFWVLSAYTSRNFKTSYWSAQLHQWSEIIKKDLPPKEADEILAIYDFLISHWASFVANAKVGNT